MFDQRAKVDGKRPGESKPQYMTTLNQYRHCMLNITGYYPLPEVAAEYERLVTRQRKNETLNVSTQAQHIRACGTYFSLTCDNEWVDHNSGIVHAVCYLKRPRPSRKERDSSETVASGMNGGECVVEGETPISQICKERERMPRGCRHAMAAIPAEDRE